MTHHDEGRYRAKQPNTAAPDEALRKAILSKVEEGKISCASAFSVASMLAKEPEEIGRVIDYLEIKLSKCQLGLFGYGKGVKLVKPAEEVSSELAIALKEKIEGNRISCRDVWSIAEDFGISKLKAACACEKLGVRISRCQLGAF
jgi:hypothetical protein